jgi:hypothetical protein
MTHESAARIPLPNAAARRGIHLVYSRDRAKNRQICRRDKDKGQGIRHIYDSRKTAIMTLAGIAGLVPLVWAAHALLHWMHLL